MESSIPSSGCTEKRHIPLLEPNGDATGAESAPLLASESDSDSDPDEKEQVLFDPDDPSMARYTKYGVWDHWEDISLAPTSLFKLQLPHTIAAKIKVPRDVYQGWPHVRRMLTDMATVEGSRVYFTFYLIMNMLSSVLPSLDLWYNSQFLRMVSPADIPNVNIIPD